jgi:hypothetical protein
MQFSADGRRLVSGSGDRTICVWDVETGGRMANFRASPRGIGSVAFSSDGTNVVCASWDNRTRVWDFAAGDCLREYDGYADVAAVAAEPDRFPWWAVMVEDETVIQPAGGGDPIARFPVPLRQIVTGPSGRIWAGGVENHLFLIALDRLWGATS